MLFLQDLHEILSRGPLDLSLHLSAGLQEAFPPLLGASCLV